MKPLPLALVLSLIAPAYADDVIVCKAGGINFIFAEMPQSELGNVMLSTWLEGEDKKFMTGELIQKSDSGDIVAEFPPRQKQRNHKLKLNYTASTGEATLIDLEKGRSTGDAINGKCSVKPVTSQK